MQPEPIKFYMYSTSTLFMAVLFFVNLYDGNSVFVALTICLFAIFGSQSYLIHFKSYSWLPGDVAIACLMTTIILYASTQYEGRSLFWYFPMVMIFYHILPLRIAAAFNIICFALAYVPLQTAFNVSINVRFVMALGMTSIFSFLFALVTQRQQRLLFEQANTDALTGLPNRRAMEKELKKALRVNARYSIGVSLLLLDVDFFKTINDKFGHLKGDEILKRLSSLLKYRLRKTDQIYRYGGEEFVILLQHLQQDDAEVLAELFRELVEDTEFIEDHPITISVGVTSLRKDDTWEKCLQRADKFLYQAKESGRNKCVFEDFPAEAF